VGRLQRKSREPRYFGFVLVSADFHADGNVNGKRKRFSSYPVKCQCLKPTTENKTSVTTHFKKLTTGNVFSYCLKQL